MTKMTDEHLDLLKRVSETRGISGHEKRVAKLVRSELENVVDTIEYDNLGSIVTTLNGAKDEPKVLIAAHMDEIGFLVQKIEKNGFLRIASIGGWWNHVIPAHEFVVTNSDGEDFFAVSGAQPPHGMSAEDRKKVLDLKDMYLDLGLGSKEEVEKRGIRVGDTVTPYERFRVLNGTNNLLGKAWDNRIGVAIGIEVMKRLKAEGHHGTVSFAGTVQEEVGLRGAKTATHLVNPDVGIAMDVTMSYDLPSSPDNDTKLGTGVALSIMDRSVIAHRGLFKFVEEVAKEKGIKYTYDLMTGGGTDSSEIHKSYNGVINMTLSLPCRYFHSHVSIINYDDFLSAVDLLTEVIKRLDKATLQKLKESKYM